jgi:hypothetical protein
MSEMTQSHQENRLNSSCVRRFDINRWLPNWNPQKGDCAPQFGTDSISTCWQAQSQPFETDRKR